MKTINLYNKNNKDILYTHTCKNNTHKITVEKAVQEDFDLSYVNLYDVNLNSANLNGANLSYADLRCSDLSYADLRRSDLINADLSSANLFFSDLTKANLTKANLNNANLIGADLPIYCKWMVTHVYGRGIRIGCKIKTIQEWDEFFESTEKFETRRRTANFKRIEANYLAVKAYVQHMGYYK